MSAVSCAFFASGFWMSKAPGGNSGLTGVLGGAGVIALGPIGPEVTHDKSSEGATGALNACGGAMRFEGGTDDASEEAREALRVAGADGAIDLSPPAAGGAVGAKCAVLDRV